MEIHKPAKQMRRNTITSPSTIIAMAWQIATSGTRENHNHQEHERAQSETAIPGMQNVQCRATLVLILSREPRPPLRGNNVMNKIRGSIRPGCAATTE